MVHKTLYLGIIFNAFIFKGVFPGIFSKGSKKLGLASICLDNIATLRDAFCVNI